MIEFIERREAIKKRHNCKRDCASCDFAIDGDSWCEGEIFVVDLLRIPSADVQTVKHGKWLDEGVPVGSHTGGVAVINVTYCSECEEQVDYRTPYCPYCGARMDGDLNG